MLDTARECIYALVKSNNHVRLLTDNVCEDHANVLHHVMVNFL